MFTSSTGSKVFRFTRHGRIPQGALIFCCPAECLFPERPLLQSLIKFFGSLVLFAIGSSLSSHFHTAKGVTFYHVPTALGLILVQWCGPAVLPAMFLNATFLAPEWSFRSPLLHGLYSLCQVSQILVSWVLTRKMQNLPFWIPDLRSFVAFFMSGLLVPVALFGAPLRTTLLESFGEIPDHTTFNTLAALISADLQMGIAFVMPILMATQTLFGKSSRVSYKSLNHARSTGDEKATQSGSTHAREPIFLIAFRRFTWTTLEGPLATAALVTLAILLPLDETWQPLALVLLIASTQLSLVWVCIANMGITLATFMHAMSGSLPAPMTGKTVEYLQVSQMNLLVFSLMSLLLARLVGDHKNETEDHRQRMRRLQRSEKEALRASAEKSQFLARLSHEIRNPLNAIMGVLDLMRHTELNRQQKSYLSLFSDASSNLLALVNDLLDVSKLDKGVMRLNNAPFNPRALAKSVLTLMSPAGSQSTVSNSQLQLRLEESFPRRCTGDAVRIRQILINLLSNALKFAPHGIVRLRCSVSPNGQSLRFAVEDNGCGINPSEFSKLFRNFSSLDCTAQRNKGGTGLGLAICKGLATAMGGDITVRSDVGKGSTFTLILPNRKPPARAVPQTKDITPRHTACDGKTLPPQLVGGEPSRQASSRAHLTDVQLPTSTRRKPALIVDDAPENRLILNHLLRSTGLEVEEAVNGAEALALAQRGAFGLILMDIQMPVMNGYEAQKAILKHQTERGIAPTPIVAISANAFPEDVQRSLTSGFFGHLSKPFAFAHLLELVERAYNNPESQHEKCANESTRSVLKDQQKRFSRPAVFH